MSKWRDVAVALKRTVDNPRWYEDGETGTRRQWMDRAYRFEFEVSDLRRELRRLSEHPGSPVTQWDPARAEQERKGLYGRPLCTGR